MSTQYIEFYERIDRENVYGIIDQPTEHAHYADLMKFIEDNNLKHKKCLEIGSSKGLFQDLVNDYTGLDIAESLCKYYHNPYYTVKENRYPFENESYDAIWTIHAFEHICDIEQHLTEMARILCLGGVIFFFPAWYCSPYAANGYSVRPYSDFNIKGKCLKLFLPVLDGKLMRYLYFIPKRIVNFILYTMKIQKYRKLVIKRIKPNYDDYWQSDSDACNSIDPFNIIMFLEQLNIRCTSHCSLIQKMFVKGGPLVFKKGK